MSKGQKICMAIVAIAMLALLGNQFLKWQEQQRVHAEKVEYWEVTVPQMAEQFAEVELFKPLDAAAGLAQEDERMAVQQQEITHDAILIVLFALLAAALVWRGPEIVAIASGKKDEFYEKRGKESPAAKKARLKREKHNHPPKRK